MGGFGVVDMVGELRRVVVRRPDESFGNADPSVWHYSARPDLNRARAEHDALVAILRVHGADIIYHGHAHPRHADSLYVYDPVLMTHAGAVLLSPAKRLRRGEEDGLAATLAGAGVPVVAALSGPGWVEGGDLLRLDRATVVAGSGARTNREGVAELAMVLAPLGIEVVAFDLPYHRGPDACLHLLSLVSIVDHGLAVAHRPLLPHGLWALLGERGFRFVDVPADELATQGPNVLATAPGRCVILADNPITADRLTAAGCDVTTFAGDEISHKAEGGPTCLTLPIERGRPA